MTPTNQPLTPEEHTREVQRLFVRHSNVLRGFILGLLPDFHEAEEVMQEVFLEVANKAALFELRSNFVGWACAIAKFKVLEAIRRRKLDHLALSPDVIDQLAGDAPTRPVEPPMLEDLHNCIEQLAPAARRILDLRYKDCQKPSQIAAALNQKRESIYVTLSRVRDFLRRCIESSGTSKAH